MSEEAEQSPNESANEDAELAPRRSLETCLARGIRQRCPRCGQGKLFASLVKMNERCAHCDLKIDRAHGYYLGAIYINYGVTSLTSAFLFLLFTFVLGYDRTHIILALVVYCCVVPLLLHRVARSMWLAIDTFFDAADSDHDDD